LLRSPFLNGLLFGLVPFAFIGGEIDGGSDVVGILFDDLTQLPTVGVFFSFVIEVKRHRRALLGALAGINFETVLAIAYPAPGRVLTSLSRDHLHAVGNHEGTVETDAKLADQIRIALGVSRKIGKKVLGAGARNRSQMRNQVFLIHSDPVVAD